MVDDEWVRRLRVSESALSEEWRKNRAYETRCRLLAAAGGLVLVGDFTESLGPHNVTLGSIGLSGLLIGLLGWWIIDRAQAEVFERLSKVLDSIAEAEKSLYQELIQ